MCLVKVCLYLFVIFRRGSPGQFAALGAAVGIHLTFVGLLPSMRPSVNRQVGAVLEDFATILASVVTAPRYQLLARLRVK